MKKKGIFLMLLAATAVFANSPPVLQKPPAYPTEGQGNNVSAIAENPDLENQINGEYPALNREEFKPLGAIQNAWDNAGSEAGVYMVKFSTRETIRLVIREFMITTVVFPRWESIEEIRVGDPSNYQVVQSPNKSNIVFIRPMGYVGLDSNITMVGISGNVYGFYVRTEGYNSNKTSDITVNVLVPTPPFLVEGRKSKYDRTTNQSALSFKEPTDYLESAVFKPEDLDFDFSMSGDTTIAPLRVFSDGVRTWFDYGDTMGKKNLPTIYVILDGVDTPINVTRQGNRLVAQAVGEFHLKSGDKTTCVYPTPSKNRT
jgi:ComB9 competence protein